MHGMEPEPSLLLQDRQETVWKGSDSRGGMPFRQTGPNGFLKTAETTVLSKRHQNPSKYLQFQANYTF